MMKSYRVYLNYIVFGFFSLGFLVSAVITLIPSEASKVNRLGYYSVCSYSPYSTIMLLLFSAIPLIGLYIRRR